MKKNWSLFAFFSPTDTPRISRRLYSWPNSLSVHGLPCPLTSITSPDKISEIHKERGPPHHKPANPIFRAVASAPTCPPAKPSVMTLPRSWGLMHIRRMKFDLLPPHWKIDRIESSALNPSLKIIKNIGHGTGVSNKVASGRSSNTPSRGSPNVRCWLWNASYCFRHNPSIKVITSLLTNVGDPKTNFVEERMPKLQYCIDHSQTFPLSRKWIALRWR